MNRLNNQHPIAWRFNDKDCKIPTSEQDSIIFISESYAECLWKLHLSEPHFSLIPNGKYNIKKAHLIDFKKFEKTKTFLLDTIKGKEILFFWSEKYAAMVDKFLFINHWDDFIYPSDESDVIISDNGLYIISNGSLFSTNIKVNL